MTTPEGSTVGQLLAARIWRRRRTLGLGLLVGAVLGLLIGWALPDRYSTRASFVSEYRAGGAGSGALGSVASGLGLNLGGSEGRHPSFYVQLVEKDDFLRRVYHQLQDSLAATEFLEEVAAPTPEETTYKAVNELRRAVTLGFESQSGVVDVTARAKSAALSWTVANLVLLEISRFDLQAREMSGRQERRFLEGQLAAARDSLAAAERDLEQFQLSNRATTSPSLRLELDRLGRMVQRWESRILGLEESFLNARLTELRDTPVVTVIDAPTLPVEPDGSAPVTGLIVGALFATMILVGREVAVIALPDLDEGEEAAA